jgi:hypothetical protein
MEYEWKPLLAWWKSHVHVLGPLRPRDSFLYVAENKDQVYSSEQETAREFCKQVIETVSSMFETETLVLTREILYGNIWFFTPMGSKTATSTSTFSLLRWWLLVCSELQVSADKGVSFSTWTPSENSTKPFTYMFDTEANRVAVVRNLAFALSACIWIRYNPDRWKLFFTPKNQGLFTPIALERDILQDLTLAQAQSSQNKVRHLTEENGDAFMTLMRHAPSVMEALSRSMQYVSNAYTIVTSGDSKAASRMKDERHDYLDFLSVLSSEQLAWLPCTPLAKPAQSSSLLDSTSTQLLRVRMLYRKRWMEESPTFLAINEKKVVWPRVNMNIGANVAGKLPKLWVAQRLYEDALSFLPQVVAVFVQRAKRFLTKERCASLDMTNLRKAFSAAPAFLILNVDDTRSQDILQEQLRVRWVAAIVHLLNHWKLSVQASGKESADAEIKQAERIAGEWKIALGGQQARRGMQEWHPVERCWPSYALDKYVLNVQGKALVPPRVEIPVDVDRTVEKDSTSEVKETFSARIVMNGLREILTLDPTGAAGPVVARPQSRLPVLNPVGQERKEMKDPASPLRGEYMNPASPLRDEYMNPASPLRDDYINPASPVYASNQ